jgi:hypothetical protein
VDLKDRSIKDLCVEEALAVCPSGLKDGNSPVLIKVNMFEEKTTTISLLLKVVVEGDPVAQELDQFQQEETMFEEKTTTISLLLEVVVEGDPVAQELDQFQQEETGLGIFLKRPTSGRQRLSSWISLRDGAERQRRI